MPKKPQTSSERAFNLRVKQRIVAARHTVGKTQQEMADLLGLQVGTYAKWENSRSNMPSLYWLCHIAAVLEHPLAYFVAGPETPSKLRRHPFNNAA